MFNGAVPSVGVKAARNIVASNNTLSAFRNELTA
jgi:hypothetical protein